MMSQSGTQIACPRCHQLVAEERRHSDPVVCDSCGSVLTGSEALAAKTLEKRFLFALLGLSVVFVLGFIQVASWGGYVLEANGLRAGELVGWNSLPSTERLAAICLELKKYDCTETLYAKMARHDKQAYAILGKFQFNRGKTVEANRSFERYFELPESTEDLDTAYVYAKTLAETGQMDEAAVFFDRILKAKPDVLQITVVQTYVKYLVNHNRLEQARGVIQQIRRKSETVSSFMDHELKSINELIKTNKS